MFALGKQFCSWRHAPRDDDEFVTEAASLLTHCWQQLVSLLVYRYVGSCCQNCYHGTAGVTPDGS